MKQQQTNKSANPSDSCSIQEVKMNPKQSQQNAAGKRGAQTPSSRKPLQGKTAQTSNKARTKLS